MLDFNKEVQLCEKLLDVTSLRHRAISSNLANINTPGFQRQKVEFESLIPCPTKEAIMKTEPHVVSEETDSNRVDNNSVTLEEEMSALMKNTLLHQFYLKALSTRVTSLKGVISGKF